MQFVLIQISTISQRAYQNFRWASDGLLTWMLLSFRPSCVRSVYPR